MAANSSTSSSDHDHDHGPRPHARLGAPWALVLALLIVAAVEVFLRTRDPMSLIAYASDEGQYRAVRDTVDVQGPAEVALIGSSQMREAVAMPELIATLTQRLGRPIRVANYSLKGGRFDAMDAAVRFLQKQKVPPRLIIVGLSPRDFRADDIDWPRVALFWDELDWWHAFRRNGVVVMDVLPVVIRNTASEGLHTLRYREEIALTLKRPLERFGVDAAEEGNPIIGQTTYLQTGTRGKRTVDRSKMSLKKLFEKAKDTYLFDAPPKPRPAMRQSLFDLVAALGQRPERGLLIELPVAEHLRTELDKVGQTKAFKAAVAEAAADGGVEYIASDRQTFQPTDNHFSDLQHLNARGARAFSIWLSQEIIDRLHDSRVPSRASSTPTTAK